MKKFFMLLVSFSLLLALVLSGCDCACASTSNLSFKNNFYNGGTAQTGYAEKLTYTVNYDDSGVSYSALKKSSGIDSYFETNGIGYDGSLVTTLKVGTKNDIPESAKQSDVLNAQGVAEINEIYIFTTELNLTATYHFKGDENPTTVNDTITSTAYFLPIGLSLAPIYSIYSADMHIVAVLTESKLARVKYDYKTLYNVEEFSIDKTIIQFDKDGNEQSSTSSVQEEYDYRKTIDNTQLLFAVRNYETSLESSTSLSVINPAYDGASSIALSKHTASNHTVTFEPYQASQESIPVRTFTLNVNSQNQSGLSHYFTVQTGAGTTIKHNGLLIKYAQPLFEYSTLGCMGALEFNLAKAEFNS